MMLEPGSVFGAYRIIRRLDAGGMGVVYEAEHVHLRVRCALKVFSNDSMYRETLRKRFEAEGRALFGFHHPRIVRVTDLAVDQETGSPYFAMDLVVSPDGEPRTLEDIRCRHPTESEIAGYFRDICEGLAYIHAHGVVHRDISLENVLIGPDGHAVLADFGIARFLDAGIRRRVAVSGFTMAAVGTARLRMGKAPYMAPELLREHPSGASVETDAWALGVLMFRMLTGFWFERERRENSLAMLAGCELPWEKVLGALLSETPKDRLPAGGVGSLPTMLESPAVRRPGAVFLIAAVSAVVFAVIVAAVLAFCLSDGGTGHPETPAAITEPVIGYGAGGEITYVPTNGQTEIRVEDLPPSVKVITMPKGK